MISIIKQPMPRQMTCGPSDFGCVRLFLSWSEYLPMNYLLSLYFARVFDCLHDLVIAGAAAEISGDGLFDLVVGWVGFFFQQLCARHDEARRAISALDCAMFDEGFLYGMKFSSPLGRGGNCKSFHGDDLRAMRARRRDKTGHHCLAIQEYGARAAFAFGAAFFCAGQHAFFAKQAQQGFSCPLLKEYFFPLMVVSIG